jgi:hypothetical protein
VDYVGAGGSNRKRRSQSFLSLSHPPTEKAKLNRIKRRVSCYDDKRNKTAQINSSSTTGAKVLSCCCRSSKRWPRKNNKNEKAKKVFYTAEELFGHGEKNLSYIFYNKNEKQKHFFFGLRAFLANMFTDLY